MSKMHFDVLGRDKLQWQASKFW